ncbi:DUF1801 domain-containing protein [Corynebacterium sp. L4756]|uniref:DUF1801 domain-containing protein n=1 Tax=unclassified Corynebacterium TaxID=2624378 RepID=UPI00374CAA98
MTVFDAIPGVGSPARRALEGEGFSDLESLDGQDYKKLLAIHGVGRRGLERLQKALVERGLSLSGDIPQPEERKNEWSIGHTGVQSEDIKTNAGSDSDLEEYLETLEARRLGHAEILFEIFNRATGDSPRLWGPSMIGYGEAHYKYATGREGDTFRVGFSPRKAKLSLYGLQESLRWEELSHKLGKHTTGASCVYVNKPEDVDLDVLETLVRETWEHGPADC